MNRLGMTSAAVSFTSSPGRRHPPLLQQSRIALPTELRSADPIAMQRPVGKGETELRTSGFHSCFECRQTPTALGMLRGWSRSIEHSPRRHVQSGRENRSSETNSLVNGTMREDGFPTLPHCLLLRSPPIVEFYLQFATTVLTNSSTVPKRRSAASRAA